MEKNYTYVEGAQFPYQYKYEHMAVTTDCVIFTYEDWKLKNPDQKKYNIALKEDINIRSVSLDETAGQASITYLSTLAVLQLDAILTNAWLVKDVPSKQNSKNQRSFERMLIMEYICTGVGRVKMTIFLTTQ